MNDRAHRLYDSKNKDKRSSNNRDASAWIVEINLLQGCLPLVPTLSAMWIQLFADIPKKIISRANIFIYEIFENIIIYESLRIPAMALLKSLEISE
jgi:hypothetical protein